MPKALLSHVTGSWVINVENDALVSLRLATAAQAASFKAEGKCDDHVKAVRDYLDGKTAKYALPIAMEGTPFQKKVWQALRRIPYGKTRSYKDIATEIGSPKAFRAVGSACGANPVAVVVPCHRVLATGGGLGGYAYGLPVKQQLLAYERQTA